MENWTWRFENPTTCFEVVAVLDSSERARYLRVRTESGDEINVWLSKRWTTFSQYQQDGEIKMEVIVPDRLAAKTGLIEEALAT